MAVRRSPLLLLALASRDGRSVEGASTGPHAIPAIVFHVDEIEGQRIVRITVTFGWRPAGERSADEDELES